jgi:alpha-1,6-mannosyltransferase
MTQSRVLFIGLSIAGAALLALTGAGAHQMALREHPPIEWIMLAEAMVYAAAVAVTLRSEHALDDKAQRRVVFTVLATAAVLRAMLVFQTPVSTDVYRYVWDGRVQASGINPFAYPPADPHLTALRDQAIYPEINHSEIATTIYPPMAQVIFYISTRVAESVAFMKAVMVAFEAVGMAAILALLARRGLPQTRILLYAWHPLPLFEFAGSGHIDAAAIGLMLLACLMADRRYPSAAGALLAGAALVKYFPVVLAPALYRRWDWRFPVAALLTCVLLYLPHLGVGWQALGFLPGYAREEGLTDGSGFFLLALIERVTALPPAAALVYTILALAALAIIGLCILLRPMPEKIAIGAATLTLVMFTVLLSPHLPWYFTWIIPFLCFTPSAALIYLTTSAPLLYNMVWTPGRLTLNAAIYAPFALLLLIEILIGRGAAGSTLFTAGGRLDRRSAA